MSSLRSAGFQLWHRALSEWINFCRVGKDEVFVQWKQFNVSFIRCPWWFLTFSLELLWSVMLLLSFDKLLNKWDVILIGEILIHIVCIPKLIQMPRMSNLLFKTTLSLSVSFPGRLCDGPSSPCRPQATSCWAPPATSSSCWRKRSRQRSDWHCHRKAGSGSCRACCWERSPTDDGLKLTMVELMPTIVHS